MLSPQSTMKKGTQPAGGARVSSVRPVRRKDGGRHQPLPPASSWMLDSSPAKMGKLTATHPTASILQENGLQGWTP